MSKYELVYTEQTSIVIEAESHTEAIEKFKVLKKSSAIQSIDNIYILDEEGNTITYLDNW